MSLHFMIQREPTPPALAERMREAKTPVEREGAVAAVAAHAEGVGYVRVTVPPEVEKNGPEAVSQFYFAQCQKHWSEPTAVDAVVEG